ncbi:uncharacterized protein LOC132580620 [Heteronotia binoei]|uniref:uncharacterized protein LOC132580620 n=1 Tax=Heteronotia binoei TaxID=13085 RepID=UPI00292CC9C1|nr:uncharacterized protein LOC132580620 [Heteronotia binoei]XP_060107566.1 uncharacterized protein LOC132580620 [Heteronotia binoei]
MGNEQSKGSSGVPDEPEACQVKMEGDLEKKQLPARKSSSDMGNGTVQAHSDEGVASRIVPKQEKGNSVSLPAEEPGLPKLQKNSQEDSQPSSLSQSTSSEKGLHAIGQVCVLYIAKNPVEHSTEKSEYTTPRIPGEPEVEPGVIPLSSEGPSLNPELQKTAENLHSLAESPVQKRHGEISPCSPAEKDQDAEESDCDDGSFEILVEVRPEQATSETAEGHSKMTSALATEHSEAPSSAEAEMTTGAIAEADGKNRGCSAVDARTTEGGEGQKEADGESLLALQVLASGAVKHADMNAERKVTGCVQNDGGYLTTEAKGLGEEHPATATRHDPEREPLIDRLVEAEVLSLLKELNETCLDPEVIEMAEAQVSKLDEHPQTVHFYCTAVTLAPVIQETQPEATTDVNAELQSSCSAQKDSTESPVHVQKQEARFSKTFYLCCSQCSAGDGEANAEQ